MMKRALQNNKKAVTDEQPEIVVDDVQFWRECPQDGAPPTCLPVKLVFTEGNINGVLLFFETHGLMFCNQAVSQIRQEIETHGQADVWLLTQR